ncbi:DUF317 domain-containing protein [Streptomyces sp. NPDC058861]|uniref:DUF317 domain-containing protein n=1 Tax=Streptomyces sp. NPDC058861 TaxID=3346653 RepID=UPI003696C19C
MTEYGEHSVLAQVSPRYLAGGGDPRWVTAPLQHAFHWQAAHRPLSPVVQLTRRDRQAELLLAPDPDHPWWTLQHRPHDGAPAWRVTFSARTPAEIVAAATDALTAGPATDTPTDPGKVLAQADWEPSLSMTRFVSPDRYATVIRLRPGTWSIEVAAPDMPWNGQSMVVPVWEALFTEDTPAYIVAAVFSGLASPEPVLRNEKTMFRPLRYNAAIARERVPARAAEDALWDRIDRLAAGRRDTPPPPSPPAPGGPLPRRPR